MVRAALRRQGYGVLVSALALGLATGCQSARDDQSRSTKRPAPGVHVDGSVGAKGSACELPVTFDVAEFWKPKAVHLADADEFAQLARQGTVTMRCEIDAKPAGKIGFLRVWTDETGRTDGPRAALEAFVAEEEKPAKMRYHAIKAGPFTGSEVAYTTTSDLMDETKQEHAFAVSTPDGIVLVHLGGMDTREHEEMLPAYELAKSSMRRA